MMDKIYSDYQEQKEFTENASHEMQTPLAVIKANLSLLMQSDNLKEDEMNRLQIIENTIKKLASLNKALILLSKIENNQFKESESISIKQFTSKIADNYIDLFQSKNIGLELNLSEDVIVKMNATLAEILLTNLIQNAIRHNIENGKIIIELKQNQLTISNSGESLTIPKEHLFIRLKRMMPPRTLSVLVYRLLMELLKPTDLESITIIHHHCIIFK
ncbi:MAG: HAMP domain-containing histidine kinase [Bacteroidetes bacterium]|nr:HAMP domain-containing histidine kinase [Bacteroidota bacterium]